MLNISIQCENFKNPKHLFFRLMNIKTIIMRTKKLPYLFFLVLFSPVFLWGQVTIYSNYNSGNDATGDGSSGNPYKTFHKAYTMASSGDIIDLTGTFDWTNGDETGDAADLGYTISKDLTIRGQGEGQTIIQAASSENSADRRVFTGTSTSSFNNIIFSNLTIRYGVCTTDNTISAGILILTTTSNYNMTVTVNNCSFENNHVTGFTSDNGFSGGAFSLSGYAYGTLTITNTTFKNNSAYIRAYGGGALYINQSVNATITSCTFEGNSGQSNFPNNYYGTSGAVYIYRNGTSKFTNCTFSDNTSDGNGGAIIGYSPTLYFTNNTIADNTTVSSSGKGGGILVKSSTVYLKNNMIANNSIDGSANDFYNDVSTIHDNGYNIIEFSTNYTFSGTGNITGNQSDLFGTGIPSTPALADNNTTNETQTIALSAGSVALNAGSNTANGLVAIPATDQRGVNRDANPDIGSFEIGSSPDITWDGSSSSDWNTGANWNGNSVPTSTDNVIIANAGTPPSIGNGVQADCNNLTINTGASLTVESGGSLITAGTITNDGTFNSQRSISNGQWHFISSPVTNATSGMFSGDFLQTWSEEDGWWYEVTSTNEVLTPAKGYGFWSNGSGSSTHTFTGTPNTGTKSILLTANGSGGSFNRANLVGNPFPSSIDWSGLDDTYGAVNYYNGTAYVSWNNGTGSGSQYIPPTQGFFVVTSVAGTFTINNSDRTHNGATSYYKNTTQINNGIIIAASNGDYEDDLWIAYNEQASDVFDFKYDAYKFFSNTEGVAQLYSISNEDKFSIDIRPELGVIPLGFKNDQNGHYSILQKQTDGISVAELEDTKLNTLHDFNQGAYEFDWLTSDSEERFILHLKTTGTNDLETSNTKIFAYQKTIYIHSTEKINNVQINIIDMMGRTVYKQSLVDGQNESTELPLEVGVYLVRLVSDSGTQVEKVVLQ